MDSTRNKKRRTFALTPVATGCVVLLLTAGAASAQQVTPPATAASGAAPADAKPAGLKRADGGQALESVTVTGIRQGIEAAISVKKNADGIVEAVSAEDIGKLPDNSIAESIARLPGITAQRTNGRAQEISIRGMSGDFASTLLNGREQVSTSDNRSAQFDQYPSELLSGVVVYKTPDGALLGQGLSGTIDLRTVRPLSFGQRKVAVNARKEWNGVGTPGTGSGTRISASYIDQFFDRKLGIAVGYARLSQKLDSTTREGDFGDVDVGGRTYRAPTRIKAVSDSTDGTRDGLMGVIEFKPDPDFSSLVDIYYSKFDERVDKKVFESFLKDSWAGGLPRTLVKPVTKDGFVDSGTWQNASAILSNDNFSTKTTLSAIGWNNKLRLNDQWALEGDISTSRAERKERPYESLAGLPGWGTGSISFSNASAGLPSTSFTTSQNYADPSQIKLMDPYGWGFAGYLKNLEVKDETRAARLSAARELGFGPLSRMNFGVHYAQRDKSRSVPEWQLHLKNGATSADIPSPGSISAGDTGIPMVSFNPDLAAGMYDYAPNNFYDIYLKAWDVKEKLTTGFAKFDIDTTLAGLPISGNVGVQIVHTDQRSAGSSIDTASGTGDNDRSVYRITQGAQYDDVLPSLNLKAELGGDQTLRLGIARVMARPRMDQMSASNTYFVDGSDPAGPIWKGSGGNPQLKPFRADALDLSYEKYFGTKGYVSVAGFYKKLKSYIFNYTNENYDFSGRQNSTKLVPGSNIGEFTQPQNGSGGRISGIELAASVPLGMLWRPLAGFGVTANFAKTDSAIRPFGDGDTRPLPGLSRRTANVTLYYEANGFSARIAKRYRSDFLGEFTGFAQTQRELHYIKGETITDLQFGYEFRDGLARGLSALLQVNNLNDTAFQTYDNTPDNITQSIKYGKSILLGLNYKF